MKKVVIAGGSGFIGQYLASHYLEMGCEIVVLSRKNRLDKKGLSYVKWDAKTYGKWLHNIEAADLLINLNGKSVDCRYTPKNKEEIYNSRIDSTYILGEAIQLLKKPPKIWVNSASATIYRHSLDKQMDEKTGEIGTGFSVDVCKKWEETLWGIETPDTRKVALRIAIVLGENGGALQPLKKLTQFGMGGKQGDGKQFFSWLHEKDLVRIIDFIYNNNNIEGVVNAASPFPEKNKVFMKVLRKVLNAPFGLPSPKWLLVIGAFFINTEAELILKSRNVIPGNLMDNGFEFEYPKLENALKSLV